MPSKPHRRILDAMIKQTRAPDRMQEVFSLHFEEDMWHQKT
jgi:hypothetical protein